MLNLTTTPEELACTLYTPSYISLEYVLQKAGVVFQYDERITAVSYLRRSIDIQFQNAYRKGYLAYFYLGHSTMLSCAAISCHFPFRFSQVSVHAKQRLYSFPSAPMRMLLSFPWLWPIHSQKNVL